MLAECHPGHGPRRAPALPAPAPALVLHLQADERRQRQRAIYYFVLVGEDLYLPAQRDHLSQYGGDGGSFDSLI